MRTNIIFEQAVFSKDRVTWESVSLPHTWNAQDGQDGGGNYVRDAYFYRIALPDPTPGKRQYIRCGAVSLVATLWCNGVELGQHFGGFSAFTYELTGAMKESGNELVICADNRATPHIYPQMGDFTLFGGIYRDVTFIETESAHFDLGISGSDGIFVTPDAKTGDVRWDAFTAGAEGAVVSVTIRDAEGNMVSESSADAVAHTNGTVTVSDHKLWNGMEDPYCYYAEFKLCKDGAVVDQLSTEFGFRSFCVDPEKGFFLNGKSYPLRGVGRHQDRQDKGWAISKTDQEEDVALICGMGANTVRLAHYQHSDYFHQLCDHAGVAVWAEVPFVSDHDRDPLAHVRLQEQMEELIAQNYNHPSIFFWGLGNELSMCGDTPEMRQEVRFLHELCHRVDPSRLTTLALMSTDKVTSEIAQIADVIGFNQYLGWYIGKVSDNGPWLDAQHAENPKVCIGLSEYGCEAVMQWHSATPKVKDYSEEYQAIYHKQLAEAIAERPWMWGTFVWNMFDFAADSRKEGGVEGRNNKGLVTYDRKIKKDSYFIYKACWSKEPFVYIAGRRFEKRAPGQRTVLVYTNQDTVQLTLNGEIMTGKEREKHIFVFEELPFLLGENRITVSAGEGISDSCVLFGVEEPEASYVLPDEKPEQENVDNWFGEVLEFPEDYYSIHDSMMELNANADAVEVISSVLRNLIPDAAMAEKTVRMFCGINAPMSLEGVLRAAGNMLPPTTRSDLNKGLTKIKK